MTVNALRKSSRDEEVIMLAKSLIKTWKKYLEPGDKEKKKEEVKEKERKEDARDKERKESRASFTGDEVSWAGWWWWWWSAGQLMVEDQFYPIILNKYYLISITYTI